MSTAAARARDHAKRTAGLGPAERRYWIEKAGWRRQSHLAKALRDEGMRCANITLSSVISQTATSDPLERRLTKIIADAMRKERVLPGPDVAPELVDYVFPERLAR